MRQTIELTNGQLLPKTTPPTQPRTMTRMDAKLKNDSQSGIIIDCQSECAKNERISHTRMARIRTYSITNRAPVNQIQSTQCQANNNNNKNVPSKCANNDDNAANYFSLCSALCKNKFLIQRRICHTRITVEKLTVFVVLFVTITSFAGVSTEVITNELSGAMPRWGQNKAGSEYNTTTMTTPTTTVPSSRIVYTSEHHSNSIVPGSRPEQSVPRVSSDSSALIELSPESYNADNDEIHSRPSSSGVRSMNSEAVNATGAMNTFSVHSNTDDAVEDVRKTAGRSTVNAYKDVYEPASTDARMHKHFSVLTVAPTRSRQYRRHLRLRNGANGHVVHSSERSTSNVALPVELPSWYESLNELHTVPYSDAKTDSSSENAVPPTVSSESSPHSIVKDTIDGHTFASSLNSSVTTTSTTRAGELSLKNQNSNQNRLLNSAAAARSFVEDKDNVAVAAAAAQNKLGDETIVKNVHEQDKSNLQLIVPETRPDSAKLGESVHRRRNNKTNRTDQWHSSIVVNCALLSDARPNGRTQERFDPNSNSQSIGRTPLYNCDVNVLQFQQLCARLPASPTTKATPTTMVGTIRIAIHKLLIDNGRSEQLQCNRASNSNHSSANACQYRRPEVGGNSKLAGPELIDTVQKSHNVRGGQILTASSGPVKAGFEMPPPTGSRSSSSVSNSRVVPLSEKRRSILESEKNRKKITEKQTASGDGGDAVAASSANGTMFDRSHKEEVEVEQFLFNSRRTTQVLLLQNFNLKFHFPDNRPECCEPSVVDSAECLAMYTTICEQIAFDSRSRLDGSEVKKNTIVVQVSTQQQHQHRQQQQQHTDQQQTATETDSLIMVWNFKSNTAELSEPETEEAHFKTATASSMGGRNLHEDKFQQTLTVTGVRILYASNDTVTDRVWNSTGNTPAYCKLASFDRRSGDNQHSQRSKNDNIVPQTNADSSHYSGRNLTQDSPLQGDSLGLDLLDRNGDVTGEQSLGAGDVGVGGTVQTSSGDEHRDRVTVKSQFRTKQDINSRRSTVGRTLSVVQSNIPLSIGRNESNRTIDRNEPENTTVTFDSTNTDSQTLFPTESKQRPDTDLEIPQQQHHQRQRQTNPVKSFIDESTRNVWKSSHSSSFHSSVPPILNGSSISLSHQPVGDSKRQNQELKIRKIQSFNSNIKQRRKRHTPAGKDFSGKKVENGSENDNNKTTNFTARGGNEMTKSFQTPQLINGDANESADLVNSNTVKLVLLPEADKNNNESTVLHGDSITSVGGDQKIQAATTIHENKSDMNVAEAGKFFDINDSTKHNHTNEASVNNGHVGRQHDLMTSNNPQMFRSTAQTMLDNVKGLSGINNHHKESADRSHNFTHIPVLSPNSFSKDRFKEIQNLVSTNKNLLEQLQNNNTVKNMMINHNNTDNDSRSTTTTTSMPDNYNYIFTKSSPYHCNAQYESGMVWPMTDPGILALQSCSAPYFGTVYRPCFTAGHWGRVDLSDCRIRALQSIVSRARQHVAKHLLDDLPELVNELSHLILPTLLETPESKRSHSSKRIDNHRQVPLYSPIDRNEILELLQILLSHLSLEHISGVNRQHPHIDRVRILYTNILELFRYLAVETNLNNNAINYERFVVDCVHVLHKLRSSLISLLRWKILLKQEATAIAAPSIQRLASDDGNSILEGIDACEHGIEFELGQRSRKGDHNVIESSNTRSVCNVIPSGQRLSLRTESSQQVAIVQGRFNGQDWARALGQADREKQATTIESGDATIASSSSLGGGPLLMSDVYLVDLVPAVSINVDFEHVPEFELSIPIVNDIPTKDSIKQDMPELIVDGDPAATDDDDDGDGGARVRIASEHEDDRQSRRGVSFNYDSTDSIHMAKRKRESKRLYSEDEEEDDTNSAGAAASDNSIKQTKHTQSSRRSVDIVHCARLSSHITSLSSVWTRNGCRVLDHNSTHFRCGCSEAGFIALVGFGTSTLGVSSVLAKQTSVRSHLEMPRVETLEEQIEKSEELERTVSSLNQWHNHLPALSTTDIILYMSFTTSIIFLVATFVIQYRRRCFEQRAAYFVIRNLTISLLAIQITFLVGTSAHLNLFWQRVVLASAPEMTADLRHTKHVLCLAVPVFLHFIHLASLFWMLGHTFWLGETFARLVLLVRFGGQSSDKDGHQFNHNRAFYQNNALKSSELLNATGLQYRRRFLKKNKQLQKEQQMHRSHLPNGASNSRFGWLKKHSSLASSSSSSCASSSSSFGRRSVRCMLNSLMAPLTFSFSCIRRALLRLVGGKFKFLMHHRQCKQSATTPFQRQSSPSSVAHNSLKHHGTLWRERIMRFSTKNNNNNIQQNSRQGDSGAQQASMQMANIFAINASSRLNMTDGSSCANSDNNIANSSTNISPMTKHESDEYSADSTAGKFTSQCTHHHNGQRQYHNHAYGSSTPTPAYISLVGNSNRWNCRDLIALAMGPPFALVVIAFWLNPRGYETHKFCWMSIEGGIQYSFVIPVLALILVNTFRMLMVMKHFLFLKSQLSLSEDVLNQYKPALRASVILLPFFAFNWFLSILSLETLSTPIFECLFAISNALFAYLFFELHCRQRFGLRLDCLRRLCCRSMTSAATSICTGMDSQECKNIFHANVHKHSRISDYEMQQTRTTNRNGARIDHCLSAMPDPSTTGPTAASSSSSSFSSGSISATGAGGMAGIAERGRIGGESANSGIGNMNECLCCTVTGKVCSATTGAVVGLPPGVTLLQDEDDEELIVVELDEDFDDFVEEDDADEAIDTDDDSELDFDEDCDIALDNDHMFCSGLSQYPI